MAGAPLIVAVDPSSKTLAFVAKNPVLPETFMAHKAQLTEKKNGKHVPMCCLEAQRACHRFLEESDAMATTSGDRYLFIEEPVVGPGIKATVLQAFINGVVQACFLDYGYKVTLVHPSKWKADVCSNGSAKKPDVLKAIRAQWPKIAHTYGSDQDIIDAAAIHIYGERVVGRERRILEG